MLTWLSARRSTDSENYVKISQVKKDENTYQVRQTSTRQSTSLSIVLDIKDNCK